jgi:osmoprotectant transport system permease protein
MEESWLEFLAERLPELWLRTGEHLMLTAVSTSLAIVIGIPLGILAHRRPGLRGPLLGSIGVLQTVPSLAMLALLLALLNRIGALPAVIALTLYALLPIARNTLTGLQGVSDEVMEASRGLGMTARQQLLMVELPLASPVVVAGIRTAAVVGVGVATLSAFIGAGGLGQFINRGLSLSNTRLIVLGAVPAALLALLVDFTIGAAQWGISPSRRSEVRPVLLRLKPVAVALPFLLFAIGIVPHLVPPALTSGGNGAASSATTIRIASKNFTEQVLLGEIMAQLLEARTDLRVERRFNLGGTMICHGALASGEIDLYAEYTGTGLTAILQRPALADPEEVLRIVSGEYRREFDIRWLPTLGFNNTYAITVRRDAASREGWRTVSDLAPRAGALIAGWTAEFSERPDGYPGLIAAYDYRFGKTLDVDPALMYQAIHRGQVDVIAAFSTDGRIAAYDLQPLVDDRRFFPPYEAAPVVRGDTLQAHPEIEETLSQLAGRLDNATMQSLNYEVDHGKRRPVEVAREFLRSQDLL